MELHAGADGGGLEFHPAGQRARHLRHDADLHRDGDGEQRRRPEQRADPRRRRRAGRCADRGDEPRLQAWKTRRSCSATTCRSRSTTRMAASASTGSTISASSNRRVPELDRQPAWQRVGLRHGPYVITGTEAQIRAVLATFAYTPPHNDDSNVSLSVAVRTTDSDGSTATDHHQPDRSSCRPMPTSRGFRLGVGHGRHHHRRADHGRPRRHGRLGDHPLCRRDRRSRRRHGKLDQRARHGDGHHGRIPGGRLHRRYPGASASLQIQPPRIPTRTSRWR